MSGITIIPPVGATGGGAATSVVGPVTDTGGQIFNFKAYGPALNGVTDDTAAMVAALTDIQSKGGGVLYIPDGSVLYTASRIVVPNTGTAGGASTAVGSARQHQAPIHIMGTGAWQSNSTAGTGVKWIMGYVTPWTLKTTADPATAITASGSAQPIVCAAIPGNSFAAGAYILVDSGVNQERVKVTSSSIVLDGSGNIIGFSAVFTKNHTGAITLSWELNDGKLCTYGIGSLAITGIGFQAPTATNDSTPFIYTTNTRLWVDRCAFTGAQTASLTPPALHLGKFPTQDAIVLGGAGASLQTSTPANSGADNSPSAWFSGYGTVINRVALSNIRRAVYGRIAANKTTVRDLHFFSSCGSDLLYGAGVEFNGRTSDSTNTGVFVNGNVIADSLWELDNYSAGIKLGPYTQYHSISGNDYEDVTTNVLLTSAVGAGVTSITTDGFLPPSTQAKNALYGLDAGTTSEVVTVSAVSVSSGQKTWLTATAAKGATSLTVNDATAISTALTAATAGGWGVYLALDYADANYGISQEMVKVSSVSGSTVNLSWACGYAHSAGSAGNLNCWVGPYTLTVASVNGGATTLAHALKATIGMSIAAVVTTAGTSAASYKDGSRFHQAQLGYTASQVPYLDLDSTNNQNEFRTTTSGFNNVVPQATKFQQNIILPSQASGTILAGPSSGSAAAPGFRAIVTGDLPSTQGIHLPGGADDLYYEHGHMPNPIAAAGAGRIEVAPSWIFGLQGIASSTIVFLSEFTAPATMTLANLQVYVSTAAVIGGGSISHAQLVLCSVSGTTYSVIGTTADASSIITTQGLSTAAITGGSGAVVKGTRYAIGLLSVYTGLTTSPQCVAINPQSGFSAKSGYPTLSAQASIAAAAIAGTTTYTGAVTTRYMWFGATN